MTMSRNEKPETRNLNIEDVVVDPRLQCRAQGIDDYHAECMAESLRKGEPIQQRIRVRYVEGRGYLLTDGHHELEAYKRAGRRTIPAHVLNGSYEDALLDAAAANKQHDKVGLKRTRRDKENAVILTLKVCPSWSNRRVAAHVGVSDTFVGDIRSKLEAKNTTPTVSLATTTNNGTTELPVQNASENGIPVKRIGRDGREQKIARQPAIRKQHQFDWKEHDIHLGWLRRGIDTIKEIYNDNGPRYKAAVRLLNSYCELMAEWKKEIAQAIETPPGVKSS